MPKLTVGTQMPDFTFDTPFESGRTLAETAGKTAGKTALVFLRYYGCTLCQYDIHQFTAQYDKIAATGGQMLVVLQSDPAKLAGQMKPGDLPFDIVCDPEQKLYKKFEIAPAESKAKMADLKTMGKIAKATAGGFKHGDYEGDELQLPACFVMGPDRVLSYAHYGVSAGDVPTPQELVELLK
ncbi:peroxiredoxin-like family protein [Intestinimonas massiliensis (ex Afouda et al. 2020)]|uniref:peroxiredoxin-like family protein n=1 Tax=Intestinimonas massiliensis (ex Afouda et al. 2020) TaxID=1673721 RepID=UPI00067E94DD|nr:peroxiredoxin-like family protein [Intestinimonas massiliensis (ex Afouda et al. 2020)]